MILSKKTWNVWNQKNQEKVLRDERLHREKIESEVASERERRQEQNLEVLRSRLSHAEAEAKEEFDYDSKNAAPFRLFGDIEESAKKIEAQEELRKKKEAADLLEKRRQGVAPWALG